MVKGSNQIVALSAEELMASRSGTLGRFPPEDLYLPEEQVPEKKPGCQLALDAEATVAHEDH